MKHTVVALSLHSGGVTSEDGEEIQVNLPEGCEGILFVFESKKAARAYVKKARLGDEVKFNRITIEGKELKQ